MEPAPATPPVTQDDEREPKERKRTAKERKREAKERRKEEERKRKEEERKRKEERRTLRERQLEDALQVLDVRHQDERRALSQELRELVDARKAVREQLWAEQQPKLSAEDGASCSSSVPLNGKEGPGKGDEKNPIGGVQVSVLKARQQREEKKQEQLKELLPAKNELHVEAQRLLQALDKEEFRKAYEFRIKVEDPREIKARQRTKAAKLAGLWGFVSKKKLKATLKVVELEGSAKGDIEYVDEKKLGYPKLPGCYEDIKKLLDIEKNPIFSETLKEWTRKEELYKSRVEFRKNQVASLKNEVYQLIGFFSVFQGVVLTAVSQSSFLFCHIKWSPIALSVLASAISTLAVIQKLIRIKELQPNIDSEEREYETAVQVGIRLRDPEAKGIDFVKLETETITERQSKSLKKGQITLLYVVLVILILVAFGVLFPVSFWSILCKPGSPPAQ